MNYQSLLLWALTAFVICQRGNTEISLVKTANGIKLFCPNYHVERTGSNEQNESLELEYEDDNSGEYKCVEPGGGDTIDSKIYVKFRPCDNCVEIDSAVLAGLVAANVVATILAAATMYSIAAHRRTAADTSNKKSFDVPRAVPDERSSRAGASEHYQSLRPRNVQKRDEYGELKHTRKQKAETPTVPPLPPT